MLQRPSQIPLVSLLLGLGCALGAFAPIREEMGLSAQALEPVTIRFIARVGDQPFDCAETYKLGSTASPTTVSDFRFYVSEVALVDTAGNTVPVALEQDGQWQFETVALLDFEDRSGVCVNGTPETRDVVVGKVPVGDYVGLRFNLGIPYDLNHNDAVIAPSPLNLTSLWWNWRGGYKFARIDLEASQQQAELSTTTLVASHQPVAHGAGHTPAPGQAQGFAIHLGSTGCQATERDQQPTQPCTHPNLVEVEFPNFDTAGDVVVANLQALVADTNLTLNQPGTPSGCMSDRSDSDCDNILSRFGITGPQRFLRLE
jgi:uncharacterized repeat protein (TIGR04052 family)